MRITRKPEQERAKLRGSGTTTEQAKVLLEEFTGASWHSVSTRVGEADTEIADLMGMSADQFFQVVLLPQGEFAKFLHADAGDRAKLLQRLFGTDRFHGVEEWLARRRKATADEVREAEIGISGSSPGSPRRRRPGAGDDAPDGGQVRRRQARVRRRAGRWAAQLAEVAEAEATACQAQVASYRRELDLAWTASARRSASLTGSAGVPTRCRPGTSWPRPNGMDEAATTRRRLRAPRCAPRSTKQNEPAARSLMPARPRGSRARPPTPPAPPSRAAELRTAGPGARTQLGRLELRSGPAGGRRGPNRRSRPRRRGPGRSIVAAAAGSPPGSGSAAKPPARPGPEAAERCPRPGQGRPYRLGCGRRGALVQARADSASRRPTSPRK